MQTARCEADEKFSVLAHAGRTTFSSNNSRTFHYRKAREDDDGKVQETQRLVEEISAIGVLQLSNSFRSQEERDVLSLRIAKYKTSNMNLPNFKAVMLFLLCSLAKLWGPQHKVARSCLWEAIARMLKALLGKRAVHEKALAALIAPLGEVATQTARCEVYAKLFVLAHAGRDRVKRSTTRLHLIADQLVQIAADRYKEP